MKKVFVVVAAFTAVLLAADSMVCNFLNPRMWPRRTKSSFEIVKDKDGKPSAVKITCPAIVKYNSKFNVYPITGEDDIKKCYEGISFEVKGDGSDEWGTIVVMETNLLGGKYYFPLKDTNWKTYTVAFADMAPVSDHTAGLLAKMPVGRIGDISFGDRWKITWANAKRPVHSYQIRNVKLVDKVPAAFAYGKYKSLPLEDVIKKMKSGNETLITCFGDSITAGTAIGRGNKRYSILLGEMLVKKFNNAKIKSECVAVGGAHTYDSIAWLERDLSKGNPDVATMLIGFNNRSSAQSVENYRLQLEMWIERLLCKTQGKTAIILIPSVQGVPRWEAQKDMAAMTYEVAKKYNCTVCPLDQVIEKIGAKEYKAKYLADGVHPNKLGHAVFAQELVKCFDK